MFRVRKLRWPYLAETPMNHRLIVINRKVLQGVDFLANCQLAK